MSIPEGLLPFGQLLDLYTCKDTIKSLNKLLMYDIITYYNVTFSYFFTKKFGLLKFVISTLQNRAFSTVMEYIIYNVCLFVLHCFSWLHHYGRSGQNTLLFETIHTKEKKRFKAFYTPFPYYLLFALCFRL